MLQVSIVLVGLLLVGLQDGISVLDELCMGSQVFDATAPVFHDDIGSGSMQLAHIGDGDGFSVESPSPNYMDKPASPQQYGTSS